MRRFVVFIVLSLMFVPAARAADWQWSVTVDSSTNGETNDHPRAFLWIPPECKHVRAVVVGQHNMEEEPILEHPILRAELADIGFAEVWITPAIDLQFQTENGVGAHFDAMMQSLAVESGYSELASAPIVPIGHSASAGFPWAFALWNPQRTLATLSVSGSFPPSYRDSDVPFNVPGLVTNGEYEAADYWIPLGLAHRRRHPMQPLSHIGETGGGHFDTSDRKVQFIALYLKKLAQYRLSTDGKLITIDPTKTGWLADRWRSKDAPTASAGPVGQYKGNPAEAFWYFDEELATAADAFNAYQHGLKPNRVAYVQQGKIVEITPNLHAGVRLHWLPMDDGISFKLGTAFPETLDGHSSGGELSIHRICGPVMQTAPDTWSLRFYRMGMDNKKRSSEIWLFAEHPGDSEYKRAVQQCVLNFPRSNDQGKEQHITFPAIPQQPVDIKSLNLGATSDAGVPVYYYVREGPAEVDGDSLKFTPIPAGAKLPIRVTVVAWQYGRATEPKLKTAAPVERTFYVGSGTAPNHTAEFATIFAKATQSIESLKAAQAAAAAKAVEDAKSAPNTISFHICKSVGMRARDLAGAVARVGNWNNLKGVHPGKTITLDSIFDKNGKPVPGMAISFTGGRGGDSFDADTTDNGTQNDSRLFNGLFDQFDGDPSTIAITGIPFKEYDLYFYRFDDGDDRGGRITIGQQELTMRGGAEMPSPDGKGYIRAVGHLQPGNYVRFENLTESALKVTYAALDAGSPIMRHKLVGFQIVERK